MDVRKKETEHLDGEILRLEQQLTLEYVEIGRRVTALAGGDSGDEEFRKCLASSTALRRSIESFRTDIDRIRFITRQIDVCGQEIDENSRRRNQLQQEILSKFTELGVGSFALYLKLADQEPYRTIFEKLVKLDLDVEERNRELRQLEAGEQDKGFFDRIKLKARKVLLRGDISHLDRAKTAAYEQAGARIAETDFARHAEGSLRHLFDLAHERKNGVETLNQESDRKIEEIEGFRQELKRLETDGRPEDRIRGIEQLGKELETLHCWIGRLYFDRDLRRGIKDDGLAENHGVVADLRESIRKRRHQIDLLKAEAEIETLTQKEKDRRGRRKQIEEEMRVKERQIGVIDIEINMGLRRIEELKRVLTGEAPYADAPPLPPLPDLYPHPGQRPP
jgi:hypothetical protein